MKEEKNQPHTEQRVDMGNEIDSALAFVEGGDDREDRLERMKTAKEGLLSTFNSLITSTENDLLDVREKYNELVMAVGNKFEGETRHETALRYIRNAEQGSMEVAQSERSDDPKTLSK